ncbi:hypothetical protein J6590_078518 [Homalodisca vitripennis]|nr:hypothetical protein J6590_078518 [Homalodisca vitripennis]
MGRLGLQAGRGGCLFDKKYRLSAAILITARNLLTSLSHMNSSVEQAAYTGYMLSVTHELERGAAAYTGNVIRHHSVRHS